MVCVVAPESTYGLCSGAGIYLWFVQWRRYLPMVCAVAPESTYGRSNDIRSLSSLVQWLQVSSKGYYSGVRTLLRALTVAYGLYQGFVRGVRTLLWGLESTWS
jgi:hypothetical protein